MKKLVIHKNTLKKEYNQNILVHIQYADRSFSSHTEIVRLLKNAHPYTITVIIENLKPRLWRDSRYVKSEKVEEDTSRYQQLLLRYLIDEYGDREANDLYARWLDKYRARWKRNNMAGSLDEYVVRYELEPKYQKRILHRYKDIEVLKRPRFHTVRERNYDVPEPFTNRIDWRNPYDAIFVWRDGESKFAERGGSGSSSQRETNSKFIFGFSLINRRRPVPSFLFLYTDENKLRFIKKFTSLTVPAYDIGYNYHLPSSVEKKILKGVGLLEWRAWDKVHEIKHEISP